MPIRYVPRVIVKFDHHHLIDPQVNDAADQFRAQLTAGTIEGSNWPQLVGQPEFQAITIGKLLTAISQARRLDLIKRWTRKLPFGTPNDKGAYFVGLKFMS